MEKAADCYSRLARAKLVTMFQDLAGKPFGCGHSEKEYVKRAAYRWFFHDSDLELWCVMADCCPELVRESARRVADRGFDGIAWRVETGKGERSEWRKRYWKSTRK